MISKKRMSVRIVVSQLKLVQSSSAFLNTTKKNEYWIALVIVVVTFQQPGLIYHERFQNVIKLF